MDVYRSLLDTEIGLEMYNIGTISRTKASGEKQPEVHGADKPLDPNLKAEHQSRSKLPNIVGSGSLLLKISEEGYNSKKESKEECYYI